MMISLHTRGSSSSKTPWIPVCTYWSREPTGLSLHLEDFFVANASRKWSWARYMHAPHRRFPENKDLSRDSDSHLHHPIEPKGNRYAQDSTVTCSEHLTTCFEAHTFPPRNSGLDESIVYQVSCAEAPCFRNPSPRCHHSQCRYWRLDRPRLAAGHSDNSG